MSSATNAVTSSSESREQEISSCDGSALAKYRLSGYSNKAQLLRHELTETLREGVLVCASRGPRSVSVRSR